MESLMKFRLSALAVTLLSLTYGIHATAAVSTSHSATPKPTKHHAKNTTPALSSHPGGWEFGVEGGYNRAQDGFPNSAVNTPNQALNIHDNNNFQWGGHVGYLFPVLSRLLVGVETGYQNLGGVKVTATGTANGVGSGTRKIQHIQDVNLLVDLRYYLTSSLAVMSKFGGALKWYRSATSASPADPITNSSNFNAYANSYFFEPMWELGMLINTSAHTNVTLMINHLSGAITGTNYIPQDPSVTGIMAGFNWDLNNLEYVMFNHNSTHPSGFELGMDVGYNRINTGQANRSATFNLANGINFDYRDYENVQYGAHMGYYVPVLPQLLVGVETGYIHLGGAKEHLTNNLNNSEDYSTNNIQAINMLVALRYYLLDRLALLGKIGGAYEWFKEAHTVNGSGPASFSTAGFTSSEIRRLFNPEWQLGFLVDLNSHLNASLVFNQIAGKQQGSLFTGATNATAMGVLGSLNWDMHGDVLPVNVGSHPGGWELGAMVGYNRIYTGQYGFSSSDNRNNTDNYLRYYDYGNFESGGHVAYNFAIKPRFLLGVEVGYKYLGGAKFSDQRLQDTIGKEFYNTDHTQAIDLLATLRLYVLKHLAVIGKLGGAYEWFTVKHMVESGTGPRSTIPAPYLTYESRSVIDPEWQAGILVDLDEHVKATLAYQQILGQHGNETLPYVTNPSVGGVIAGVDWDMNDGEMMHVSKPHASGVEWGMSTGYDLVNTGQAGNQADSASRNNNNAIEYINYYDYGNVPVATHLGYNFAINNRFVVGFETGYQYLGGAKYRSISADGGSTHFTTKSIQAIDTLASLRFYVSNNLAFMAKAGAAFKWYKVNQSTGPIVPNPTVTANGNYTANEFNIDPEWQLGLSYDVGQHVSFMSYVEQIIGHPGMTTTFPESVSNPTIMAFMGGINIH